MDIFYESKLQQSIYDPALHPNWFSVNKYYNLSSPVAISMDMLHAHTEVEIMYLAKGKALIVLEGGEAVLRRGDFIFLDSMVPHMLIEIRESPWHILNIEAALSRQGGAISMGALAEDGCFKGFMDDSLPAFSCRDDENAVYSGINNLQRLLRLEDASIEADLQLSCILLEIGRLHSHGSKKQSLGAYVYVKRALSFIDENFDRDISVDDVADAARISKSHLQRVFHQMEGVTIVERINRLRLEKAEFLLKTSGMPVVEVAVEVGFNSRQYFTNLFKLATGRSPASYRKHHLEDSIVKGHANLNEELRKSRARLGLMPDTGAD